MLNISSYYYALVSSAVCLFLGKHYLHICFSATYLDFIESLLDLLMWVCGCVRAHAHMRVHVRMCTFICAFMYKIRTVLSSSASKSQYTLASPHL